MDSPLPQQPTLDGLPLAPEPPADPRLSTVRNIFFGPFGLRAGWGLLLYVTFFFLIATGIRTGQRMYQKMHPAPAASASAKPSAKPANVAATPQPVKGMIIGEGIAFGTIFLISWLMSAIERRRISAYGLGGSHPVARFLVGAFWGLIAMSLLIASLRATHLLTFDAMLDHGLSILTSGLLLALGFFLVGLFEEYLFRGYLQFTLTRGLVGLGNRIAPAHARTIAFWMASFITSAFFLSAHTGNPGENPFGLVSVFLAGVVFVVALWRTGSLWWAIGFHTSWDWAQSFLYGVADSGQFVQGRLFATHASGNPLLSGGSAGPEGSLFIIPVLSLIIVVLFYTHPSPQPPLETRSAALPASPGPDSETAPLIA